MVDFIAAAFIMFSVLWLGFADLDVGGLLLVFALLVSGLGLCDLVVVLVFICLIACVCLLLYVCSLGWLLVLVAWVLVVVCCLTLL